MGDSSPPPKSHGEKEAAYDDEETDVARNLRSVVTSHNQGAHIVYNALFEETYRITFEPSVMRFEIGTLLQHDAKITEDGSLHPLNVVIDQEPVQGRGEVIKYDEQKRFGFIATQEDKNRELFFDNFRTKPDRNSIFFHTCNVKSGLPRLGTQCSFTYSVNTKKNTTDYGKVIAVDIEIYDSWKETGRREGWYDLSNEHEAKDPNQQNPERKSWGSCDEYLYDSTAHEEDAEDQTQDGKQSGPHGDETRPEETSLSCNTVSEKIYIVFQNGTEKETFYVPIHDYEVFEKYKLEASRSSEANFQSISAKRNKYSDRYKRASGNHASDTEAQETASDGQHAFQKETEHEHMTPSDKGYMKGGKARQHVDETGRIHCKGQAWRETAGKNKGGNQGNWTNWNQRKGGSWGKGSWGKGSWDESGWDGGWGKGSWDGGGWEGGNWEGGNWEGGNWNYGPEEGWSHWNLQDDFSCKGKGQARPPWEVVRDIESAVQDVVIPVVRQAVWERLY